MICPLTETLHHRPLTYRNEAKMLNRYTIVHELLMQLCYAGSEKRVFARRFNGDKRYVVRAIAGCGNCSRDEYIVTIGGYELSVTVRRLPNENSVYTWYRPYEFSVALTDGKMHAIESTRQTHVSY